MNYGTSLASLEPKSSMDVKLISNKLIVGANAKGGYERVPIIEDDRSGACRFSVSGQRLIVGKAKNSLYRVLNSGVNDFNVVVVESDGSTESYPLTPDNSIDLYLPVDSNLFLEHAGGEVKAIYDRLNRFVGVRSGRFKTTIANATANSRYLVLDAERTTGTAAVVTYRVLNSGTNDFAVYQGDGSLDDLVVKPRQSVDVRIETNDAATNKLKIGLESGSSTTGVEVSGIIDFVGRT